MSYKSSTSASATFNFQADLEVECFDVRRLRLFNLEKHYKSRASSDNALIEKITSEDEEVRRRFYDVIDDWTEFDLHVYAAN